LLAQTLFSLSHKAVNFFVQLSQLASFLAINKGLLKDEPTMEPPEKAVAGITSARNNPKLSAAFLTFMVCGLMMVL